MTDVHKMFADLTAAIEDLHSIAVEGQAPNLTPDIQLVLLAAISTGLNAMSGRVTHMTLAASDFRL